MIPGDISKGTFLNALSNLDIHLHQNFIDGLNVLKIINSITISEPIAHSLYF